MTIAVVSHPECLLHFMGDQHPECPERIEVIRDALVHSDLNASLEFFAAPLASREQLIKAHSPEYVDEIFRIAPGNGFVTLDADTAMNPHSLPAALRAAGAVIFAVDLVCTGKTKTVFCNIRPPGHHATFDQAMGFCFFNNVAVGIMHAFSQYQLKKIAIVDFDVHHGNGTEDIFREDERVLLCSSFQHPFYPDQGADTQSDHIINIPLSAGTDGRLFREEASAQWLPKLEEFKPELIFFSAGFDAHANDVMSNLAFRESDYFWISEKVRNIATKHAQGRMISVLEGGYALSVLGPCVVAHLRGLIS